MFVSTLFSIFNLEENEVKAVNLFHRVNLRRELDQVASRVVCDLMKISKHLLKSFKENNKQNLEAHPELTSLQKRIILNLKHVKSMKRQLDFYKLETLYFEDDLITKIDMLRTKEKTMLKKALVAEKVYEDMLLKSRIMEPEGMLGKSKSMSQVRQVIIQEVIVSRF